MLSFQLHIYFAPKCLATVAPHYRRWSDLPKTDGSEVSVYPLETGQNITLSTKEAFLPQKVFLKFLFVDGRECWALQLTD